MKSNIGHIQINIQLKNIAFYKRPVRLSGWSCCTKTLHVGVGRTGSSLWFTGPLKECTNDYDGPA
jgi:hypothetical protein